MVDLGVWDHWDCWKCLQFEERGSWLDA